MKKHTVPLLMALFVVSVLLPSCSINRFAVRTVADALTSESGSTVFTGDDDPELVADALPFALKLYESLLDQQPDHRGLILSTGSGFIMYANAFIQTPALMLPFDQYLERERMLERAKRMYLRGRDGLLTGLEKKYPGFLENLHANRFEEALSPMRPEDVPFLYWTAAGWLGAVSIDSFDLSLSVTIPRAAAIMARAYELEPDYNNGALHDLYISYYGSMPEGLGGDREKARYHFERSVELTGGRSPSPYLALATSVSIPEQNVEEFRSLLTQALAIDPYADRSGTLAAVINRRKAAWYLENIEDFFFIENEEFDEEFDTEEEYDLETEESDL